MVKLLGDNFNDIDKKYQIIEDDLDKKKKKKIILRSISPSTFTMSLNSFADLSDSEFKQHYLLPAEFFDTEQYKPINKIFEPKENYTGTTFHGHDNWLSDHLNQLINDPEFDIFRETLKKREKKEKVTSSKPDYT